MKSLAGRFRSAGLFWQLFIFVGHMKKILKTIL